MENTYFQEPFDSAIAPISSTSPATPCSHSVITFTNRETANIHFQELESTATFDDSSAATAAPPDNCTACGGSMKRRSPSSSSSTPSLQEEPNSKKISLRPSSCYGLNTQSQYLSSDKTLDGLLLSITSPFTWASPDSAPTLRRCLSDPENSLGINIKAGDSSGVLLLNYPLSPEDAKIVAPSASTPSRAKAGSSAAVTLPVGPAILSLLFSQAYQATMMQPELKDHEPDTESEVAVSVETSGKVLIIRIKCPCAKTLDVFTKISLPIESPFTWASPDSQQSAPTPRRWVSDPMSSPGINKDGGVVPGILLPSFSGPSLMALSSELNKSCLFTTPQWTAMDLNNLVRGSSTEVYLVVKDSRSSSLEMYNIRTRSTVIIREYDDTPFSGYILLATNLEGWILLSRNTHAYFLNLILRDHSDLPMLNRNVGPSAQGGFCGLPNRESALTVVLELEFHQALIMAHRPSTGWLYFNVPAEVQMLRIESFKVTVNRIFWVASDHLFCCSHEQFLWRNPIAMGGYHKSVLDYRGNAYLLVVNQELTGVQIFYVNDENGELIAKGDFNGLIFTTRGAGGVVSPSGSLRVLGAGGLWGIVECFEVSMGGHSRVIKSCNHPVAEDECGCHFGWVAFGPRSE